MVSNDAIALIAILGTGVLFILVSRLVIGRSSRLTDKDVEEAKERKRRHDRGENTFPGPPV